MKIVLSKKIYWKTISSQVCLVRNCVKTCKQRGTQKRKKTRSRHQRLTKKEKKKMNYFWKKEEMELNMHDVDKVYVDDPLNVEHEPYANLVPSYGYPHYLHCNNQQSMPSTMMMSASRGNNSTNGYFCVECSRGNGNTGYKKSKDMFENCMTQQNIAMSGNVAGTRNMTRTEHGWTGGCEGLHSMQGYEYTNMLTNELLPQLDITNPNDQQILNEILYLSIQNNDGLPNDNNIVHNGDNCLQVSVLPFFNGSCSTINPVDSFLVNAANLNSIQLSQFHNALPICPDTTQSLSSCNT
ncbi:hypothetical protein RFI_16824, partial [Reticulomyxa filosa]